MYSDKRGVTRVSVEIFINERNEKHQTRPIGHPLSVQATLDLYVGCAFSKHLQVVGVDCYLCIGVILLREESH
jgi:hypothetical protein